MVFDILGNIHIHRMKDICIIFFYGLLKKEFRYLKNKKYFFLQKEYMIHLRLLSKLCDGNFHLSSVPCYFHMPADIFVCLSINRDAL